MVVDLKDIVVIDDNIEMVVEIVFEVIVVKFSKVFDVFVKKLSFEVLICFFELLQQKDDFFEIYVGDIVCVGVCISEGNKECVQFYEGVVIFKCYGGFNQIIIVCWIFQGIGVEWVFMLYSFQVVFIKVEWCGKVCRVKFFYLWEWVGKVICVKQCFDC